MYGFNFCHVWKYFNYYFFKKFFFQKFFCSLQFFVWNPITHMLCSSKLSYSSLIWYTFFQCFDFYCFYRSIFKFICLLFGMSDLVLIHLNTFLISEIVFFNLQKLNLILYDRFKSILNIVCNKQNATVITVLISLATYSIISFN